MWQENNPILHKTKSPFRKDVYWRKMHRYFIKEIRDWISPDAFSITGWVGVGCMILLVYGMWYSKGMLWYFSYQVPFQSKLVSHNLPNTIHVSCMICNCELLQYIVSREFLLVIYSCYLKTSITRCIIFKAWRSWVHLKQTTLFVHF